MKYLLLTICAFLCVSCGHSRKSSEDYTGVVIRTHPGDLVGYHGYVFLLKLFQNGTVLPIQIGPLCLTDEAIIRNYHCQIVHDGDMLMCDGHMTILVLQKKLDN
jgi:hypothetical protein